MSSLYDDEYNPEVISNLGFIFESNMTMNSLSDQVMTLTNRLSFMNKLRKIKYFRDAQIEDQQSGSYKRKINIKVNSLMNLIEKDKKILEENDDLPISNKLIQNVCRKIHDGGFEYLLDQVKSAHIEIEINNIVSLINDIIDEMNNNLSHAKNCFQNIEAKVH